MGKVNKKQECSSESLRKRKKKKNKRKRIKEKFGDLETEISLVWSEKAQTLQQNITLNNSQYQLSETYTDMHVWYICIYEHTNACVNSELYHHNCPSGMTK